MWIYLDWHCSSHTSSADRSSFDQLLTCWWFTLLCNAHICFNNLQPPLWCHPAFCISGINFISWDHNQSYRHQHHHLGMKKLMNWMGTQKVLLWPNVISLTGEIYLTIVIIIIIDTHCQLLLWSNALQCDIVMCECESTMLLHSKMNIMTMVIHHCHHIHLGMKNLMNWMGTQ